MPDWFRQLRSIGTFGWSLYLVAALLLAAVVAARLIWDVPVGDLVRDPAVVAGTHPFVGWISNVGVLGLSVAASICLFTASVLRRHGDQQESGRFMFSAGLLTGLWMIDDLFMLHDEVFPDYLGVSEILFFVIYAVLLGFLVVRFRHQIRSSNYAILVVSILCFGLSMLLDVVSSFTWVTGLFLFEDGSKLFGIVSWALYFGGLSYHSLVKGD